MEVLKEYETLPDDISGDTKIYILDLKKSLLIFYLDPGRVNIQEIKGDKSKLIETREGIHYIFDYPDHIILISEVEDGIRAAVYYDSKPKKVRIELPNYKLFSGPNYEINHARIIENNFLLNIIRENKFTEKYESVIYQYIISDDFLLEYDHTIICKPLYLKYPELSLSSDRNINLYDYQFFNALGYDLLYEDLHVKQVNDVLIAQNGSCLVEKNVKGECLFLSRIDESNLCYVDRTPDKDFITLINFSKKIYYSFGFNTRVMCLKTNSGYVWILSEDAKIIKCTLKE